MSGIAIHTDKSISLRSARGIRLYYVYGPPNRKGIPPAHRHRFQFLLVELALTYRYYKQFLLENPIYFPAPLTEVGIKPELVCNLTLADLAEFLRSQCVSVSKIQDAAFWALHWLKNAKYSDETTMGGIKELQSKLQLDLETHGLPAGLNECIAHQDGTIELCPSFPMKNLLRIDEPLIPDFVDNDGVSNTPNPDITMAGPSNSA
ncbi:hypothetical protein L218DRAFT_1005464 [Marasmius fiardii PR-910]|nr:hypothetical protein L218DRAFT_1005464 [Marasmius fiardii PR-910]